jgi:asparaginyl-tRNA synthetase
VTERQLVKSLIFETGAGELVLVLIGGDQSAISGSLKKVVGDRNVRLASPDRVRAASGYGVGAIPPFSWQPPGFRTFVERSLANESHLAVGAGQWGHEILLAPDDLIRASSATLADLCTASSSPLPKTAPQASRPTSPPNAEPLPPPSPPADRLTEIRNLPAHVGKVVTLGAWLHGKRSSGGLQFLQLRDGTGFTQATVERSTVTPECWQAAEDVSRESSCLVTGLVRAEPRSPSGYELAVQGLTIVSLTPDYPIGAKEHGADFLFSWRHLHVRSPQQWAVLRIRAAIFYRLAEFLHTEGYARVDTPILQPSNCEDSTQLFTVDYFGDPMYLSQSGQLYLEVLMHSLGKVYDFGPVFRAEQSKTRKHLCEFWMLDWETPYHDQPQVEHFLERMIRDLVAHVLASCHHELAILERDIAPLQRASETPFPRIELRDAIDLLNKTYDFALRPDDDLSAEAEEKLAEHFRVPVFVKNYPYSKKAFYMQHRTSPDGVERATCADLLAPDGGGEIATCAVRENSYDRLIQNLADRNQSADAYQWYIDVRKYGGIPHAGGGLGPERILRWVTGVHHIRETIAFPRTLLRRTP